MRTLLIVTALATIVVLLIVCGGRHPRPGEVQNKSVNVGRIDLCPKFSSELTEGAYVSIKVNIQSYYSDIATFRISNGQQHRCKRVKFEGVLPKVDFTSSNGVWIAEKSAVLIRVIDEDELPSSYNLNNEMETCQSYKIPFPAEYKLKENSLHFTQNPFATPLNQDLSEITFDVEPHVFFSFAVQDDNTNCWRIPKGVGLQHVRGTEMGFTEINVSVEGFTSEKAYWKYNAFPEDTSEFFFSTFGYEPLICKFQILLRNEGCAIEPKSLCVDSNCNKGGKAVNIGKLPMESFVILYMSRQPHQAY